MVVHIFNRACINYIREVRNCFRFYGNEIHTCATVKDHIEAKIFKILYIISHKIYNNRVTAESTSKIYTYFKSNGSRISFGRKHCKYDMHNFHASFLGIALKSFIDGKDYCTKCL